MPYAILRWMNSLGRGFLWSSVSAAVVSAEDRDHLVTFAARLLPWAISDVSSTSPQPPFPGPWQGRAAQKNRI